MRDFETGPNLTAYLYYAVFVLAGAGASMLLLSGRHWESLALAACGFAAIFMGWMAQAAPEPDGDSVAQERTR